MPASQFGHTDGSRLSAKKGVHRNTNVKNTTPNTLVAFCSSRMMRPCRYELRIMTLDRLALFDRCGVACCCGRDGRPSVDPYRTSGECRFPVADVMFTVGVCLRIGFCVMARRNGWTPPEATANVVVLDALDVGDHTVNVSTRVAVCGCL